MLYLINHAFYLAFSPVFLVNYTHKIKKPSAISPDPAKEKKNPNKPQNKNKNELKKTPKKKNVNIRASYILFFRDTATAL